MSYNLRKIDSARAARLYRSGLSLSQVAKVMGFTTGGIHDRLRKDGVPMRRQGIQGVPVDTEVLVQLREQGLSVRAIGKLLGMNYQTIYSRLRKRRLSGG